MSIYFTDLGLDRIELEYSGLYLHQDSWYSNTAWVHLTIADILTGC